MNIREERGANTKKGIQQIRRKLGNARMEEIKLGMTRETRHQNDITYRGNQNHGLLYILSLGL
jgi:peptidyl-tRNA hydrolase